MKYIHTYTHIFPRINNANNSSKQTTVCKRGFVVPEREDFACLVLLIILLFSQLPSYFSPLNRHIVYAMEINRKFTQNL